MRDEPDAYRNTASDAVDSRYSMAMEKKIIDQKEYLRRYICFGDDDDRKKKKKKKKHKTGAKTVKIIDDDIDLRNVRPLEEGEFDILLEGEDAPQIAGIIDERGPVDFTDKRRWKIITDDKDGDLAIISVPDKQRRDQDDETSDNPADNVDLNPSKSRHSKSRHTNSSLHTRAKDDDSDPSPVRHSKHSKNKSVAARPDTRLANYDSDLSPPRQSINYDSDQSPPRQSRNNDSDSSPPRKSTKQRGPPAARNRDSDSDFSPPRKRKPYESRRQDGNKESSSSSRRKEHRSRRDDPPRANSHRADREYECPRDSSRQGTSRSSRDKRDRGKEHDHDDHDRKPRAYSDTRERRRKSRWGEETDGSGEGRHAETSSGDREAGVRMTKTLDGKTAGLQDARALQEETRAHKQREAEQFSKLSKAVSGVGQSPIVRDKMGRKRNLEAEAAEKRERDLQQREINEKYAKWGKGLKQVEDREEQLKSDLHEMSKPLARYADDADLDRELRQQERDGDPMLQYIKQKQIKEGKRKPDAPQYQGSYTPNRFGVKPGHRWDGVDRSNGYEKRWFEAQNARVARQEEAYKWSTADM